jgi:hypothetical protein
MNNWKVNNLKGTYGDVLRQATMVLRRDVLALRRMSTHKETHNTNMYKLECEFDILAWIAIKLIGILD